MRDRDSVYGAAFRRRVQGMRIREVLTAAHSPWQNPFAERLIGSVRRECLDHVLVLSERHLRRVLTGYFAYYHRTRTHLALAKDAPDMRPVQRPEVGCRQPCFSITPPTSLPRLRPSYGHGRSPSDSDPVLAKDRLR
jgi:putative transposase